MTDNENNTEPVTVAEATAALRELERLGLAKRTGEFRNGKPVYVATEYWDGKA